MNLVGVIIVLSVVAGATALVVCAAIAWSLYQRLAPHRAIRVITRPGPDGTLEYRVRNTGWAAAQVVTLGVGVLEPGTTPRNSWVVPSPAAQGPALPFTLAGGHEAVWTVATAGLRAAVGDAPHGGLRGCAVLGTGASPLSDADLVLG